MSAYVSQLQRSAQRARKGEPRRARDGMHYRPRKGSAEAQRQQDKTDERAERFAERDAEYRAALGLGPDDPMPASIGPAHRHGHPRARVGGRRRDAVVSVPAHSWSW